ncbi:phospho-sugar mutase [Lysinibacillus capsici]|uniref:phospho-sugar mutase n=1 Tax=Lysinibacillus capsici TaxID=2115968 RepID=UPI002730BCD9|nr:phospho-sugar mutase [Lysinibacillus capsici]MDP1394610.1 phospho-sugar mutase [Lysinibacillus capsici]MDP1415327.1 phospho-sugar mutase [Lysinibacillus capsici]MDP1430973.1 phospho-sugar mutase [Lysinibacillus capsici]
MNVQELINCWLAQPLPSYLIKELTAIASDEQAIEDRFYQYVSFGTGGMRGLLGAGTNRMNIYTIRRVAEGLACYIESNGEEAKQSGVVLAYDTRHFSYEFACETASVLGAHGIRSYIYKEARPTPQLSFTVRKLNAYAGVVITASHNPKQYNGFKVYGEDGAQLTPKFANDIIHYMNEIKDIFAIKVEELALLEQQGYVTWLSNDIDNAYLSSLLTLKSKQDVSLNMKLVYTPLHGAGLVPVSEGLRAFGFQQVHIVEQQAVQDGEFPTVPYPNPEESNAFDLAMKLGEQIGADLLLATDPDADRLGLAVKSGDSYELLTGNQVGALLLHYILSTKQKHGSLPQNGVMLKTIVTSELGAQIADKYGVATVNTLTGFKYIAEKIAEYERTGEYSYLFGYEESYGYLIETFVRDKDAVQVALKVAEMAAYYETQGHTLLDQLDNLYKEYGYYKEALLSQQFEGKNGQAEMQVMLQRLRDNMPKKIANLAVLRTEDYLVGQVVLANGTTEGLTLPKENVVKLILEDDSWIAIRPSGTEPKCKFYIGVVGDTAEQTQQKLEQVKQAVLEIVK